jgi:hypothetical protein
MERIIQARMKKEHEENTALFYRGSGRESNRVVRLNQEKRQFEFVDVGESISSTDYS